jgi:hypothetical protein
MKVIEAVARILKTEGVEWISCFPNNQLIEAVAKEGIRTVMFRQERGGLMAADGYSRLNDREKFGVTITQGGPGSENTMGGIAQAFSDNIPVLYLPGGPTLAQYAVRPTSRRPAPTRRCAKPPRSLHIRPRSPAPCAGPSTTCATDAAVRSSSRFPPTWESRKSRKSR